MSLTELARRVWFFIRRDRMSADLAEEMRLHVELRARREREAGFDDDEATHRAQRQFGNRTYLAEESRAAWGMRWADELMTDLKYGIRALRRAPLPGAIIIVTLAIGIGATLAMFTVMDAALFRPLPLREPDRLVIIPNGDVPLAGMRDRPSRTDLAALRARRDVYDDVGAYAAGGLNLTGGLQPVHIQVGLITPAAFQLLGVQPSVGRLFTEDEGGADGPDIVVLSHRVWRSQFNGDPAILGKQLSLNDRPYQVVGVMPPRFNFPEGSDVWIPLTIPLSLERTQIFRFIINANYIARLAPGVSREQADARFIAQLELDGWKRREGQPLPQPHQPMRGFYVGDGETRLLMVMGLATLLLVAACANICGLLLTRWSARRREIAVRAAIGASRRRLIRQLTTESAVLAALGAIAGLGVAFAAQRVFNALMPPELAALTPPRIDERALIAMLGLAIGVAIAMGTLPALAASRGDLTQTLKSGSPAAAMRPGSRWFSGGLVVLQVALAVVLLVGSGLLVKSLTRLHAVEMGIRPEQVVTARIVLSRAKYDDTTARRRFYSQLDKELHAQPGVVTAAFVSPLPLRGEWHPPVAFDLPDRPELKKSPFGELVYASPEYFATMGIRVLAGRALVAADTLPGGGMLISDSLARAFWPGASPIGVRVSAARVPRVIVGVVNDVRGTELDGAQHPQIYVPFSRQTHATIVVRSELPADVALAGIRAAVERVDPLQVVYDLKTMEQVAAESVAEQRATSVLASLFGAVTLFLAALGLYGLLAFGVVQRIPELGIRFALGARRAHVIRDVVGNGIRLAALGAALGLAAAWYLTRLLDSLLFGVAPNDPMTYVVVPALLLVTASAAALIPAMRAARTDPVRALRAE